MAMEVQAPLVPNAQSRMWSIAEPAAEAADDRPRAAMMAAPRWATVGIKVFFTHASSLTTDLADWPLMVQCDKSGYWVAEWLPQMISLAMSVTEHLALAASWANARL